MNKDSTTRHATLAGLAFAFLISAGIWLGSGGMAHFDPALVWYAVGSVLAAFAVAYRFTIWASRPPSRMYFKRGLQLMRGRLLNSGASTPASRDVPMTAPKEVAVNFAGQNFIRRRSLYCWVMHLCLSGGCTLAFAITFPLVFGWVHFSTLPMDAEIYQARVFGVVVDQFPIDSVKAIIAFNLLNIAAVIVLVGLVMAAWRRLTDAGERATQTFAEDILPLILICAVTITGLMLTVSYKFMEGRGHSLMAIVHMVAVLSLIFYIPFGKLFHMFQRSCALCVSLYKRAGKIGPRAQCVRCEADFASQMHVDDLKTVLDELGFNYRFATSQGEVHYQDVCPVCRRRLMALNQGKTLGR